MDAQTTARPHSSALGSKKMNNFLISIIILIFSSSPSLGSDNNIVIEDYIVGAEYEIVAVDNNPVVRAEHGQYVTVVPNILLSKGLHRLTVRYINPKTNIKDNTTIDIDVEVKEGNRYRLINDSGNPKLIIVNEP